MKIFSFKTVSDDEVKRLMSKIEFKNLFRILNDVSLTPGTPQNWLITSIDHSSEDGKPRVTKGGPSHYNSNAVDITPLTNDLLLSLPIPLNRNLLLMRIFKSIAKNYAPIPIIAFESDHLHCDVFHAGGVAYYVAHRPTFDKRWSLALRGGNPIIKEALNSKEIIYI